MRRLPIFTKSFQLKLTNCESGHSDEIGRNPTLKVGAGSGRINMKDLSTLRVDLSSMRAIFFSGSDLNLD
jgi:hypothetical protein